MELKEAIKILEEFLLILGSEYCYIDNRDTTKEEQAMETVLKYIKEESISKTVVEEKIEEIDYSYKNIEKNYTEEQLDNYDVSEEDYIEMKKREFAEMILQEILNKGE